MLRFRALLLTASAAAAVMASGAALAAAPHPDDKAAAPETSGVGTVQDAAAQGVQPAAEQPAASDVEIIVTARRRSEQIQDVPISVSVLSGDQLEKSGVTDVQALQYRTPSLSITSAQSQRNTVAFSLRGQRAQETQLFTDPPVGTYFAEVVQPRPYGFGKTFYDLESVQVLKGVQGTLFGRNMTGGAVLVEPAHPVLGELSGEVRGQYGNYNMYDLYGVVNVPLGSTFALRVAAKKHHREGWAQDISGLKLDDQNYDTFRVSALWNPNDKISSLTIFDWYKSDEVGTASFLTSVKFPSVLSNYEGLRAAGLIDANIPAQFAEAQQLFYNHPYTLNIGAGKGGNLDYFGGPYEKIKNWGIQNKTTFDLTDNVKIKNIFGYRKQSRDMVQDFDGIPAFLITPNQFSHTENISEELQLQGKAFDKKLDYILGAFYFQEKGLDGSLANTLPELNMAGARLNPRTASILPFITSNPGEGYAKTAAAFAAATFHVTDQLSLSGGVRYNWDKRKITVSPGNPYRPDGSGGTGVCIFDTDVTTAGTQTVPWSQCHFSNSATFDAVTYDATVQYEPSNAVTAYASFRHGFRSGGFSTRATNPVTLAPFKPEYVDEYEVGLKTSMRVGGRGRFTTSTALFRQDGSDVQKQRATFVNGNVFTIVDNTASQRNTGGEFEATLRFPQFTLNGFYSYTKVEILSGASTAGGLPEIAQRGVPRHQLGLTSTISPPLSENVGQLDVVLNWTWRSEIFLDDFEIQGRQAPYSLVNARVELHNVARSGVDVALFANNLLNEKYRIGVLGLIAEGLGFQSSVFGEPRMYGVELGFKF